MKTWRGGKAIKVSSFYFLMFIFFFFNQSLDHYTVCGGPALERGGLMCKQCMCKLPCRLEQHFKGLSVPSPALWHCFPPQTDSVALNSSRTYWRLAKWLTSITRACVPTPALHPGTGAGWSWGQPSWARKKGIPYDHAPVLHAKSAAPL